MKLGRTSRREKDQIMNPELQLIFLYCQKDDIAVK